MENLYKDLREMVKYIIDTEDDEVIDGYTETFVNIVKSNNEKDKCI